MSTDPKASIRAALDRMGGAAREAISETVVEIQAADALVQVAERRKVRDRRGGRPGGRRALDRPMNAWSTGQLAYHIGMRSEFVLREIHAGEIRASLFGSEYRIHSSEVHRYLTSKGFPVPDWMQQSA